MSGVLSCEILIGYRDDGSIRFCSQTDPAVKSCSSVEELSAVMGKPVVGFRRIIDPREKHEAIDEIRREARRRKTQNAAA